MIIDKIVKHFANLNNIKININFNQEIIISITETENLIILLNYLKTEPELQFEQLIDLCAIDYLHYGVTEWSTESATINGFNKFINKNNIDLKKNITHRFAIIYNLLSLSLNHRIRVKCLIPESNLTVPSVISIWPSANWYEREAFDLFGIYFSNHPDLRRILTDYNCNDHPFRKDYPLGGDLEVRFDAKTQKVIYEPTELTTMVSVPKVIRKGNIHEQS